VYQLHEANPEVSWLRTASEAGAKPGPGAKAPGRVGRRELN